MIRADPGKVLISVDLSQAESWVVAFLANEPNMKKALTTGDIHTEAAGALFHLVGCQHEWIPNADKTQWDCHNCGLFVDKLMRYVGKRYNHASSYRMGPDRAAEVINKDSDKPPYFTVTFKESKKFNAAWHDYFHLKDWWQRIEDQLSRNRTIVTCYGRSRTFFAQWGNVLFKEATAFEPQSTVGDHFNGAIHPLLGIKGGLIEVRKQLVLPYKDHEIINQSHDSAILHVPMGVGNDIAIRMQNLLRRPMVINGEEFTIPVDGEMGERWSEMEKVA